MTVGNFQLTLEAEIPNAIFVHRVIRIRLFNPPALIGQIRVPCGVERSIHHVCFFVAFAKN
jgi:hypothetical protein